MTGAVDVLVTEFRMKDGDYIRGANNVKAATKDIDKTMSGAISSIGKFGLHLGKVAVVAGGAAVGALVALGWEASKTAAHFDTFERMFGGALGSMEAGKNVMAALEGYATRSAFGLEALTQASTQLAAGGLSIARFLPTVEKFALVISGVDPQGLEQVAGALLRAKGGGFGEAMEVFRRAGIGANDFRGVGVNVGKDGQVKATADQFFNALEKLVQGRIANMANAISGGAENKLSNASDAIQQAFRRVGSVINEWLLPKVESFTAGIMQLTESGALTAIADSFLGLASSLTGSGSMEDAVWGAAKALYAIPHIVEVIGKGIGDMLFGGLSPLGLIDKATGGKFRKDVGGAFFDTYLSEPFATMDDLRATNKAKKSAGAMSLAQAEAGATLKESPVMQPLQEIATNTRASADALQRVANLQETMLGGGGIAKGAASAVNLNRALGTNRSASRADNLALELVRELKREAMESIISLGRTGTLAVQGRR